MKVFYSPYTLHPVKRANRLSSLDPKHGVLLKGVLGSTITFADYFPHLPLGDRTGDQFLDEFKFQNIEYDKKVFDFLLRDIRFQKLKPKKFFNHQLWTGTEELRSKTIKYKLLHPQDRSFIIPMKEGIRVRLDGNAMFTKIDFLEFVKSIPKEFHSLIDYVEDPVVDKDWTGLPVNAARDFIEGTPFDYYIYKPNCEFKPKTEAKIIYSAYLGGDLGKWHTYCELFENGDFNNIQGITAFDFYQGEKNIYQGSYDQGFNVDMAIVHEIYQEATDLQWKSLCSM
jgi:hypothetical protein